jgi:ribosomal protein S16
MVLCLKFKLAGVKNNKYYRLIVANTRNAPGSGNYVELVFVLFYISWEHIINYQNN